MLVEQSPAAWVSSPGGSNAATADVRNEEKAVAVGARPSTSIARSQLVDKTCIQEFYCELSIYGNKTITSKMLKS